MTLRTDIVRLCSRACYVRSIVVRCSGITIYFLGDVNKLHLKTTEVALRVHDACCGSDVFGTDICTCRPYLIYAIDQVRTFPLVSAALLLPRRVGSFTRRRSSVRLQAVRCAQRGGVGLIIYFQKEGRSLGEVTKFRVYNARKAQKGGDTAENYFYVTESIAGIRDARVQEIMPDVVRQFT